MRLRVLLPFVFLAALVAVGCGGRHHTPPQQPPSLTTPRPPPPQGPNGLLRPCNPQDYAMQCAAPRPGLGSRSLAPFGSVFAYGIDFGWSCPNARALGAIFGASYLSTDGSKNWTRACVSAYHAQGLATVVVWETAAARASAGYYAGRSDAQAAGSQAAYLGEPSSRPIYFAVDYDTSLNPGSIVSYFRGIDSIRGPPRTGAYGGIATIRELFGRGLVRYGWQTAAWSGGSWDGRAQIQQYSFGASLDWNRAIARDYGQWPYKPPPPPSPSIPYTYWQACSALGAIHFWKAHGGHGHVSSTQHRHAVAIRLRLARATPHAIGCARPGWQRRPPTKAPTYPYWKPPTRAGALA